MTDCPDCVKLRLALYRAVSDWQWEKANKPRELNGRLHYANVNLHVMRELINKKVAEYIEKAGQKDERLKG